MLSDPTTFPTMGLELSGIISNSSLFDPIIQTIVTLQFLKELTK